LNPVGLVDYGRISQDTGHTFDASKEAATGIAARYYMNRNYFVADPDAFTVSTQTIKDQSWHESSKPSTLDEAEVSISLAAVSGGMFEIGDDLPSLSRNPERLALIENTDLINMIRLGKASIPVDLMTYSNEDKQPSIFLLKEDKRQSILTVFNWTTTDREHTIDLAKAGLPSTGQYKVTNVLDAKDVPDLKGGVISFHQPGHSVRVLKLVDTSVPAMHPDVTTDHPSEAATGAIVAFAAESTGTNTALLYQWDFGDGVTLEGKQVSHTYTEPGDYEVHLSATGLGGLSTEEHFHVHISGHLPTKFDPPNIKRLPPAK